MKKLFPLNTFQQDAVLKRLGELKDAVEDVDNKMPYDEETDTYSIEDNLSVEGDLEVTGDVSVGETSNVKVFENIVDKYGHKRFIEGEVSFPAVEGLTKSYGKWSLSGTHFMYVVAGTVANGTVLTNKVFYITDLPQWIMDKIYPVFNDVIEVKSTPFYSSDWSSQNAGFILNKAATLNITCGTFTATADRQFRCQFDLLIDDVQVVNP